MIYNFALIGEPVEHSKSPKLHKEFFKKSGLRGSYICLSTPRNKLGCFIKHLQDLGFKGANITVPYKKDILEFVDECSPDVNLIQSANTLIFTPNGKIKAENTDHLGFSTSLPLNVKRNLKKALLLGSGGSARGVCLALLKLHVQEIYIVVRNRDTSIQKANNLIAEIKAFNPNVKISSLLLEDLALEKIKFDLVINTTPVGMSNYQEDESPVSEEFFKNIQELNAQCFFYDLVYNPKITEFMKLAEKNKFQAKNGEDMLYIQAAHSFSLWTGVSVDELLSKN